MRPVRFPIDAGIEPVRFILIHAIAATLRGMPEESATPGRVQPFVKDEEPPMARHAESATSQSGVKKVAEARWAVRRVRRGRLRSIVTDL
jgi:hypothetical protein